MFNCQGSRIYKKSKGVTERERHANHGDLFTEYHFHYVKTEVVRRYSTIRLRNQSEQLLNVQFIINMIETN